MDDLKKAILEAIDRLKPALNDLSQFILTHPEVGYQEILSSAKLVEFLKAQGFEVTAPLVGMDTAFKAGLGPASARPHLAFLAEYDALPDVGHGCGHNLIAVAGLAAGLGLAPALLKVGGRLSVIGTPAEEVLVDSGKMRLVEAGMFKDVDAAMIAHPSNYTKLGDPFLALNEIKVEFRGQTAHAAADPFRGINAFDALQLTFAGLSYLRQQLRPDARVHWGDVRVSGAKNIIPDLASATIDVRARDDEYAAILARKVVNCVQGAALMTGAAASYQVLEGYKTMKIVPPLEDLYRKNLSRLGVAPDKLPELSGSGSTDMGNVSKVTPSIHPFFRIAEGVPSHSTAFCEASSTERAFESAMTAAKAMALTGLDLLTDPEALKRVKEAFEAK